MTHFRHREVLVAEDDRIVFLYKNGDRAEVMFGDIDNIEKSLLYMLDTSI